MSQIQRLRRSSCIILASVDSSFNVSGCLNLNWGFELSDWAITIKCVADTAASPLLLLSATFLEEVEGRRYYARTIPPSPSPPSPSPPSSVSGCWNRMPAAITSHACSVVAVFFEIRYRLSILSLILNISINFKTRYHRYRRLLKLGISTIPLSLLLSCSPNLFSKFHIDYQ